MNPALKKQQGKLTACATEWTAKKKKGTAKGTYKNHMKKCLKPKKRRR